MATTMQYKKYVARIEYDQDADLFHGEIANLRDVVTFQGRSVDELRAAFRESVEDYLAFCTERGEAPDKPLSGEFVVRIPVETHRNIVIAAALAEKSMNTWIKEALEHAAEQAVESA